MDYMQLQVKPHFFLNSLNLIHTMAQKGDTGGIARKRATAKYLRYIFQSDAPRCLSHKSWSISVIIFHYAVALPERFPVKSCLNQMLKCRPFIP
ncbi:MAG: histidine kinase [Ruthenibacterium lactatiformans]